MGLFVICMGCLAVGLVMAFYPKLFTNHLMHLFKFK